MGWKSECDFECDQGSGKEVGGCSRVCWSRRCPLQNSKQKLGWGRVKLKE